MDTAVKILKKEVMNIAKGRNPHVFMYHSCGVCTLRDRFELS